MVKIGLRASSPLLLLLGIGWGCALSSPFGGDEQQGGEIEIVLAPGEDARPDAILTLLFSAVAKESRCPTGYQCILSGNAEVRIGLTLGKGPTHEFTLNTNAPDGPTRVEFGGYTVTLKQLAPYPQGEQRIEPKDYRARFEVSPRR